VPGGGTQLAQGARRALQRAARRVVLALLSGALVTSGAAVPDGNFTLTATATEKDGNGDISTTGTASEHVSVNPTVTLTGLDGNNDAVEGTQLVATFDDPNAGSDITYTWTVGGHAVQGATGNTYTPTEADEGKTITVSASFTDSHGNAENPSASAGTV